VILAATEDGVHDVQTAEVVLAGHDVGFVVSRDAASWALADRGRTVLRRDGKGAWKEAAHVEDDAGRVLHPLDDGRVLVGTAGAHVLALEDGALRRLSAFDVVPGRATWYNPASSGRPDIWSFAGDGGSIFVSVHVGGLWRSDDAGESWQCVLQPEVDIHQVAAGDSLVVVAAQGGFATSRDRGDTWTWTTDGLHASYLQSVALTADSVFVGASSGPFGKDAAVYRASPPGARFERRSSGLPESFEPIGPYHLAADGEVLAVAPWNGTEVFASEDGGGAWSLIDRELPRIRSLLAA
jgi:photosystem II stability/assembly factor-like uncharacterized protein